MAKQSSTFCILLGYTGNRCAKSVEMLRCSIRLLIYIICSFKALSVCSFILFAVSKLYPFAHLYYLQFQKVPVLL